MRLLLSVGIIIHSLTILQSQNVGINEPTPIGKLHIKVNSTTSLPHLRLTEDENDFARIKMENSVHNGVFWDIAGKSDADANQSRLNFFYNNHPNSGDKMTIMGNGNIGIGTSNPGNKLRIHGNSTSTQHVLSASVNYSGNVHIRAIEGFSTPANGYGDGGYFKGGSRGIFAEGAGGNSSGHIVGVYGNATGSGVGTRSGVFGTASGGSKNYAGYFASGHVYITNELRIGPGALDGATGYKVAIDGKVIAEEMRIQLDGSWPDYVFDENYNLMPLDELEKEINTLGHLPGIPSATEVEVKGIMVGDMNRLLLEKIEELTLHVIRLQKEIDQLKFKKD